MIWNEGQELPGYFTFTLRHAIWTSHVSMVCPGGSGFIVERLILHGYHRWHSCVGLKVGGDGHEDAFWY